MDICVGTSGLPQNGNLDFELSASSMNVFLSLVVVAVAEHGGIDTSVLCEISSGIVCWNSPVNRCWPT